MTNVLPQHIADLVKGEARRAQLKYGGDANDYRAVAFQAAEQAMATYDTQKGRDTSWCGRMVRWKLMNHCRAMRKGSALRAETNHCVGSVPDKRELSPSASAVLREIWLVVDRLSPAQRDAVTLIYRDGMSLVEAAERLEISVGGVVSRLSKAMRNLKHSLKDFKPCS